MAVDVAQLLSFTVKNNASDLHLSAGLPPMIRVDGDVRLIGAEGGDGAAQQAAFQAARRAILRCQSDGYPLPADKYDQWREVEMTFDPSGIWLTATSGVESLLIQ